MGRDTCIKAGTYCPVCRGMPISDCWHYSSEFRREASPTGLKETTDSLQDMVNIVTAFSYSTQLGKSQRERFENAKSILKDARND